MSKKDLLKISLVVTLLASASSAFAAAADITTTTAIGNASFSPSASVHVYAESSNGSSYQATAWHNKGNRTYYGNNSDPKIYYSNANDITSYPSTPATSWSSL